MSVQVWVEKGRIRLKAPFQMKDACKRIPGYRWDGERKAWHYPATAEVAGALIEQFSHVHVDATLDFIELAGRARQAEEARRLKTAKNLPAVPGERLASWLHQLQAYHFAKGMDAVMLGIGMGGGKSKVSVDLLDAGWPDVSKVLVICPNNVVKVWPKEFAGAPDNIPAKVGHQHRPWRVVNGLRRNRKGRLVAGSVADRRRLFDDVLRSATTDMPVAVIVNYEAAPQGELGSWILAQEWDVVVLDESHRIKSPGGVQSKFCEALRPHARRRLCLTGTPMPHSPLDIYAQYRFLDPGVFGTSYARFRQRYAVMGGWQNKQVLGMNEELQPELEAKIARLAYIITNDELDEVLGLQPPVWPEPILVELGAKARQAYDQMYSDLVAGIEEGVVVTNNALTQLLRLQQITSGHLPVEGECPSCEGEGSVGISGDPCPRCDGLGVTQRTVQVGTEKLDAFAEWLADLPQTVWTGKPFESEVLRAGEPVVVACRFVHDLDGIRAVAEKQGRRYGELSGRRNDGLTEYATMNPDSDVIGVQIQAGGVGIDLTRAHYVANFSVGFSLGDFEQWLKRTHRPGQNHRVVYQNFAVGDSVDVSVYRALAARQEVVGAVIRGAKAADA